MKKNTNRLRICVYNSSSNDLIFSSAANENIMSPLKKMISIYSNKPSELMSDTDYLKKSSKRDISEHFFDDIKEKAKKSFQASSSNFKNILIHNETERNNSYLTQRKDLIENDIRNKKILTIKRTTKSKEIVASLSKLTKNDIEKAWVIFYWIGHNIEYDTKSYFSGKSVSSLTMDVLRTGKSVCSGYAHLFQEFCDLIGLQCFLVSGTAKGLSFDTNKTESNHAWNLVKIDAVSYLMDSTWGAGHLRENEFIFEFNPFYFMVNPEHLIYTHFPEKSENQLLAKSRTMEKFINSVALEHFYFDYGIKNLNITEKKLVVLDEVTLFCEDENNLVYLATVKKNGTELEGYTWIERAKNKVKIIAQFPCKGNFELLVFAKRLDSQKTYHKLFSYDISVQRDNGSAKGFPMTYKHFEESECFLYEPKTQSLKINTKVRFDIKIKNCLEAYVIIGEKWNNMTKTSKECHFHGDFLIDSNKVTIYGKFQEGKNNWGLVQYEVRN